MRERLEVLEPRYGVSKSEPAQSQGYVSSIWNAAKSAVGMKGKEEQCSKVFTIAIDYEVIRRVLNVKNRDNDTYGILRLLNNKFGNILTSLQAQWQCNAEKLLVKAWIAYVLPLHVLLEFKQDDGLKMTVADLWAGHIIPVKFITDYAEKTREPFDIASMLSSEDKGTKERKRFDEFVNALTSGIIQNIKKTMGGKFEDLENIKDETEAKRNLEEFMTKEMKEELIEGEREMVRQQLLS